MCLLLNGNKKKNELIKLIEEDPIFFREEFNKFSKKEKRDCNSCERDGEKKNPIFLSDEINVEKIEKRDIVKKEEIVVESKKTAEEEKEEEEKEKEKEKEKKDSQKLSNELEKLKISNNNNNTNIPDDDSNVVLLEIKGRQNAFDNDKKKENKKEKGKEQFKVNYEEPVIETSEINFIDIPHKDKYMILFLTNCIKLHIINIVMYIMENENYFLTNITVQTNLYMHLKIKAFFTIKDYKKCIRMIEENKNSLANLDILYIYADCLYKQKKYQASIENFNIYLSLCKHNNISASIYLKLYKMYTYLKQYNESKRSVKNSMQLYKSSYSFLYLSIYYLKKKKYVTSYKLLYKSNELSLFNHKLWAYMTVVFLHLNMKKQADRSFSNFLKMKKYDEQLIQELIEVYKKYGYEREVKQLNILFKCDKSNN